MQDESLADVVVLAGEIARICVGRITSAKERVPAESQPALSELVEILGVAARGEHEAVDAGHLYSLGGAAVDLSQHPSVKERDLFDALGATAYAVDAALGWEASRSPEKHAQACANLCRAARGALRARRRVEDDVLLVAISTDPGPPLSEWAVAGAAKLNSPELAEGFRRAACG